MQADILERYPELDIQVYAIWFNMLPSDHRGAWDPELLTDPRAAHYWNENREIGLAFAGFQAFPGGRIAWDIYYLFDRDAIWEATPEPLRSSGYTVFGQREILLQAIQNLLIAQ